jgi:uncharacterized protein YjiS (DUF1127 family)
MLAPQVNPTSTSFVAAIRNWVRRCLQNHRSRAEFAACDNDEIVRVASDLGLSPSELRDMAKRGPDAAQQLIERMAALHLDANAIAKNEPATMRDMQRLCTNCVDKKRCQRDLVLAPNSPIWQHYCLNTDTLGDLQREAAKGL